MNVPLKLTWIASFFTSLVELVIGNLVIVDIDHESDPLKVDLYKLCRTSKILAFLCAFPPLNNLLPQTTTSHSKLSNGIDNIVRHDIFFKNALVGIPSILLKIA